MKIKLNLAYLWKLPLCGIAFFMGMALGGALLSAIGLEAPAMPEGTDANTVALWFLLGSVIIAFSHSFLSQRLAFNGLLRWLVLAFLTWGVGAVGMVLESYFFMDTGAVDSRASALFTMLSFLLPSIFVSGMVVCLFQPAIPKPRKIQQTVRTFWEWGMKILAALLAYPSVYFFFGLLVQPFVLDYYAQGMYELQAPTWGQLIPLQLARSTLFLLVCLPVIIAWRGTRGSLWLALGASFFVLTAFMAVLTAYWFPWQLRLFHGLELLADALSYTGVLIWLFANPIRNRQTSGLKYAKSLPQ